MRKLRIPVVAMLAVFLVPYARSEMAADAAADIVSVRGDSQFLRPQQTWQPAEIDHDLFPGDHVKTGAYSGMGLLFQDRTQIRLSADSMLQVQQIAEKDAAGTTRLRLDSGRAWTRTKRLGGSLFMETPSVTAAIRGTDWDLSVDKAGVTTIAVFSGEVDFSNAYGQLLVSKNEVARAEPGRAPIKLQVINPRERVQWVSAYRADPMRFLKLVKKDQSAFAEIKKHITDQNYAEALTHLKALSGNDNTRLAAQLMRSDLLMSAGDTRQSVKLAEDVVKQFPEHPDARAHLARLYLITDRIEAASQHIQTALAQDARNVEALLVQGLFSRLQGDEKTARTAYARTLQKHVDEDRAWYGLGIIESEREAIQPARAHLNKAIELNAQGLGYQGELATLETFANNFSEANPLFEEALEQVPDDYVALTGRGLLRLKQGKTSQALDDFLTAGLMEPGYARAHMFQGVAYYQLGQRAAALEAFEKASEIDPKDPLPHLLVSMIQTDLFRPGEAVAAALKAQQLLPYLKSINQVVNDQKGTANLGRAMSFFGLSEWADSLAQSSYSPYWAGSHLFLADRYQGLFNKNSELYQGFLTDPTVFGAGPRFKTLFDRPGIHLSPSYGQGSSKQASVQTPFLELRGFDNRVFPMALFFNHGKYLSEEPTGENETRISTGAIGAKLTPSLGLFTYFNQNRYQADIDFQNQQNAFNFIGANNRDMQRQDIGLAYRFSPRSQLWLKAGQTTSEDKVDGTTDLTTPGLYQPTIMEVFFDQNELGLRHTFELADNHEITWGLEYGKKHTYNRFLNYDQYSLSQLGYEIWTYFQFHYDQQYRSLFLSDRIKLNATLTLQTDLSYVDFNRQALYDRKIYAGPPYFHLPNSPSLSGEHLNTNQFLPRIGVEYKIDDGKALRLAYQNWIRPPASASLAPVSTAGIPIDDRALEIGGEIDRLRAQLEWQWTSKTFSKFYIDHKKINNNRFSTEPFTISEEYELKTLSNPDFAVITNEAYEEYPTKPDFSEGRVHAVGMGINHIVNDDLSVFARYRFLDSKNTSSAHDDKKLPYHPEHSITFGGTWVTQFKTYLVGTLTYRTARFVDEANTVPLKASFDGTANLFWESEDKHLLVRLGAVNFLDKNHDTFYSGSLTLQY